MLSKKQVMKGIVGTLTLSLLGFVPISHQKSTEAYYANYSLAGLVNVAMNADNEADQSEAILLLEKKMDTLGYDNLVFGGKLYTYQHPTTLSHLLNNSFVIAKRNSTPYKAFVKNIPSHGKLVHDYAQYIITVPDVQADLENGVLRSAARTIDTDGLMVQRTNPDGTKLSLPLFSGLLVHEADHLSHKLPRLLSEYSALSREKETLETYLSYNQDVIAQGRVMFLNDLIHRAEYLQKYGDTFQQVYPTPLTAQSLISANMSPITLKKYENISGSQYDKELSQAIKEYFALPVDMPKTFVISHISTPIVKKQIPDVKNGNNVVVMQQ